MSPLIVATLRVLSRRSTALWMVVGVLAAPTWLFLAWTSVNNAASTHPDALMLVWRVVAAISLAFLGAQFATAVIDTAREGDALQPGRRRALASAAVALGNGVLLLFIIASAVLAAWTGAAWMWTAVAEASMAFTTGAGLVLGVSQRRWSLWFLPLGVALPFISSYALPDKALVDNQAPAALYIAWLLAWPLCAALVWWLLVRRPHPIRAMPTLEQAAAMASDRAAQPTRGIEPMLGQARWLLSKPLKDKHWIIEFFAWSIAIFFFVWIDRGKEMPSLAVFFAAMGGWWMAAYQTMREGVRPTLLLIPGRHLRERLGWTLFTQGLRRGSFALWWLAMAVAAILWTRPHVNALQILVPAAILMAGGALSLACLLSVWVWVRRRFWREIAQLLTAGVSAAGTVIGAAFWYAGAKTADAAYCAQGLLGALALAVLSIVVVSASTRAWRRADLHALFSPSRDRLSERSA